MITLDYHFCKIDTQSNLINKRKKKQKRKTNPFDLHSSGDVHEESSGSVLGGRHAERPALPLQRDLGHVQRRHAQEARRRRSVLGTTIRRLAGVRNAYVGGDWRERERERKRDVLSCWKGGFES